MATKPGSGNPSRKAAAGRPSAATNRAKAAAAKSTAPKAAAPKAAAPKAAAPKAAAPKATAPKATAPKVTPAVPKAGAASRLRESGAVAVLDDESSEIATDPTSASGDTDTDDAPANDTDAQERRPWPVRLYLGEIGYDFIGKRKLWYAVSAVLILICLGSMVFRGFNLGVEFAGGERFRVPGTEQQLEEVSQAVEDAGAIVTSAQSVGSNQLVLITADLSEEQGRAVTEAIADSLDVDTTDVANSTTSASWGQDITSKAVQGLLVFLVLVTVFLAVRFQWKMAVGAMVAMVHDLVITAGVYSLVGFEVTPASVIGLLTILGFSLYDTVVVFDKVDENAKGLLASQRRTYSESANLAINQVLMRSINTSIFALLPVLGLLYAGVFVIGEGTLQDLALVLFVGMLAGVYSSIFLAAPVLCDLKEREPEYQKLAKRVNARRAGTGTPVRGPRKKSVKDAAASRGSAATTGRGRSRPAAVAGTETDMGADIALEDDDAAVRAPAQESAAAESDGSDDENAEAGLDADVSLDDRPDDRPDDSLDDGPDGSGADSGENSDGAAAGGAGTGTVTASARRTRPRSTRTAPTKPEAATGKRLGARRGSASRNG